MTLRYITLGLDYNTYIKTDNQLRYEFQSHTRFLSNYFSRAIRKYKFDTNGAYNMISIALLPCDNLEFPIAIVGDVLRVNLTFKKEKYDQLKGSEDCSYYLELLEEGFRKVSSFKPIPLDILLNLIEEFKLGGCKNIWLHKKKSFKEYDLEIVLTCEFTTNYFELLVIINQISSKKELIRGIAIRTQPDEIYFDKMFKDILIHNNFIVITDASNSERILIDLLEIKKGFFNRKFAPYVYSEDYTEEENKKFEENHNEVIKMLSYKGNSNIID
jgi:hypothetical protein